MPVEIKNRQKLLMIVAVVALVLLVGDSVVLEPLIKSWKGRQQEIADLRDKVENGTHMLERADMLRSRWDSMQTNALPSNESLGESELLKAFERWEGTGSITRVGMKPQWKQGDDDSYATLECRADYNGDISGIKRLLYELEKDPIGIKVDDVEISSRDDKGQELSLGLQVSGLQLNPPPQSQQP